MVRICDESSERPSRNERETALHARARGDDSIPIQQCPADNTRSRLVHRKPMGYQHDQEKLGSMSTKVHADSSALSWRIEERPGFTIVNFCGEIDENADFSELRRRLKGSVVFRLEEVRRINSCGVREWVNFVRDLPSITDLTFTHCSPAIVTQLNMIYNFRGDAKVRSFYAPYVCEHCSTEEEKLLDVETQFPGGRVEDVPVFECERCHQGMEFDDLPERYLSFLMEA